jgi:AcrR family transcriptional regulator
MSLYNHFSDKDALLDALHEAVLLDVIPLRRIGSPPWNQMATAVARTLRRGLRAHPNALMLFATRPLRTPAFLQAAFLLDSVGMFTIGHTLAEFGSSPVAGPERNGEDLYAERALLAERKLHHLTRVVAETRPRDYDAEFEIGLGALLDGFEVRLDSRTH